MVANMKPSSMEEEVTRGLTTKSYTAENTVAAFQSTRCG